MFNNTPSSVNLSKYFVPSCWWVSFWHTHTTARPIPLLHFYHHSSSRPLSDSLNVALVYMKNYEATWALLPHFCHVVKVLEFQRVELACYSVGRKKNGIKRNRQVNLPRLLKQTNHLHYG